MKLFLFFLIQILVVLPSFCSENYNVYQHNELNGYNPYSDNEKILFIVDLSNSMNEYIGGLKKSEIAFRAFASIISRLSPNIQTGLRVYGHKYGFSPIFGCKATELLSPIRENNAHNIYNILSMLKPNGWTPITKSLKDAVNFDFAGISGKKRIILLTDGAENCDESPCDFAINLVQTRDDIRIDVIEFAVNDDIAEAQLKCTALTTNGKIYRANDTESLIKSFEDALNVSTDVQGTIIRK